MGKIFGHLECDIMDCVWDMGSASVKDVYEILRQRKSIAYTTVMTVTGRLAEKGLLNKEQSGNKYIYSPVYSKQELMDMVSKEVLTGLLAEDHQPVLSNLTDAFEGLDREELELLKKEIDKVIEDKNGG